MERPVQNPQALYNGIRDNKDPLWGHLGEFRSEALYSPSPHMNNFGLYKGVRLIEQFDFLPFKVFFFRGVSNYCLNCLLHRGVKAS
jgi:hypothetical protein